MGPDKKRRRGLGYECGVEGVSHVDTSVQHAEYKRLTSESCSSTMENVLVSCRVVEVHRNDGVASHQVFPWLKSMGQTEREWSKPERWA